MVDEKLFRESKQSEGKYFSHLLLNSILAYGSRHSDRLEVRSDPGDPNSAGKLFLEKAEALLPFDMKWPSITTIQALAILGSLYCVSGFTEITQPVSEMIDSHRPSGLMRLDGYIKGCQPD